MNGVEKYKGFSRRKVEVDLVMRSIDEYRKFIFNVLTNMMPLFDSDMDLLDFKNEDKIDEFYNHEKE